jgi:hypothetical protein
LQRADEVFPFFNPTARQLPPARGDANEKDTAAVVADATDHCSNMHGIACHDSTLSGWGSLVGWGSISRLTPDSAASDSAGASARRGNVSSQVRPRNEVARRQSLEIDSPLGSRRPGDGYRDARNTMMQPAGPSLVRRLLGRDVTEALADK